MTWFRIRRMVYRMTLDEDCTDRMRGKQVSYIHHKNSAVRIKKTHIIRYT